MLGLLIHWCSLDTVLTMRGSYESLNYYSQHSPCICIEFAVIFSNVIFEITKTVTGIIIAGVC